MSARRAAGDTGELALGQPVEQLRVRVVGKPAFTTERLLAVSKSVFFQFQAARRERVEQLLELHGDRAATSAPNVCVCGSRGDDWRGHAPHANGSRMRREET